MTKNPTNSHLFTPNTQTNHTEMFRDVPGDIPERSTPNSISGIIGDWAVDEKSLPVLGWWSGGRGAWILGHPPHDSIELRSNPVPLMAIDGIRAIWSGPEPEIRGIPSSD